ncbi:MAG: diphthine synthase [Candidatus Diapherotrites archaeon]|uniref:Diphthine synthase n=1 Tax=Candidatus Iainarchaeum sp. TaxID=3101447 RepID=A0A2D6LZX6_9ARCH|nr:diphthine synthase [Candidatus Diapherotrites archaeon]|tara:strand:+ start:2619 stop:3383 length:765 start_codon:yes stop_codon:yes gene_type:complete
MFYLIGIGLKSGHLTIEAKQAIESCSKVFFENYTSKYSEGSIAELEQLTGKKFVALERKGVEEGFELLLKESKQENIALLVFGNALNATTHLQLLIDAKKLGAETKVVAGLSIFDFLPESGLDSYKFGRVTTIVAPRENYAPESFYNVIEANHEAGLHTLCLLDIDAEKDNLVIVSEALAVLEKIEKSNGKKIVQNAVLIGLYGLGCKDEKIKAGTFSELTRSSYAAMPQSLIVAGNLNEKEKEALRELADWND